MDFKGMTDDEMLENILEVIEEDGRLNMAYLDIEVVDAGVTYSGRVSSEEELQIISELMRDTFKIADFANNVWVDETLILEDHDDTGTDFKGLDFDDGDIDDEEYSDDDDNDSDK
jgi:hypothetical protein